MEAKDFYFELSNCRTTSDIEDQWVFAITPKAYYDAEGCLSDEEGVAEGILPDGFEEVAESQYEYHGDPQQGRQLLLSLGMKEISFGLAPGEKSSEANDEEYAEDEDMEEEGTDEDELDEMLKEHNCEPNPFDYKNVSTDKLLRHMSIMLSTDAFEEAAKIRDELIGRGITEF